MTIELSSDLEVDIEAVDVGSIHVVVKLQTVLLVGRDSSRHQSGTVIQVSGTRTLNENVPALCCKHTIESYNFQISIFLFFFGRLKYKFGVKILFAITAEAHIFVGSKLFLNKMKFRWHFISSYRNHFVITNTWVKNSS